MPKGPAVVVVARHGARLDAANKAWHLTSPTPYDPPLTYGGWSQGKALGLRIAALLYERDNEQAEAANNGPNDDLIHYEFSKLDVSKVEKTKRDGLQRPKKNKKRKIIIHSSPYQRCVQTSTAVAAGLSQYQPPATPQLEVPSPSKERSGSLGKSPLAQSPHSTSPLSPLSQPADPTPAAHPSPDVSTDSHTGPDKILLRIDAFLGEWLSPDYFDDITPPPNSTMMVAGAKANLLRRGEHIHAQPSTNSSKGNFPGGWAGKSTTVSDRPSTGNGASPTMGILPKASHFRERSSSYSSTLTLQQARSWGNMGSLAPSPTQRLRSRLYQPPVPSYAVSPADPIPRGYVAHAREACVEVDFQWDSMRPPQDWGDGGEYGDEWSTMHKRFRRGLAGMMEWYKSHGSMPPKDQVPGFMFKVLSNKSPPPFSHPTSDSLPASNDEVETEDDEELVLVLITHGAGCNALLGAMSNTPVLIDVGLASLSMAVRRNEPRKPSVPNIQERRSSVADPGMSETYEMKLLASVDHLRPGVDPSKPPQAQPQTQSPAVPSPSLEYRRRFTGSSATNSPIEPFSIGEPYRSWNSSLGSMRRNSSSGSNSKYVPGHPNTAGSATGLWSGARAASVDAGSDGRSSPGADMALNFANQRPKSSSTTTTSIPKTDIPNTDGASETKNSLTKMDSKEERETSDKSTPLINTQVRTKSTMSSGLWGAKPPQTSANGLWGPPKLDGVQEHEKGLKRRWTVTARKPN